MVVLYTQPLHGYRGMEEHPLLLTLDLTMSLALTNETLAMA